MTDQVSQPSGQKEEVPLPEKTADEIAREAAFEWINKAPPEELMKNTRFAGILGQRQSAIREQVRQEETQLANERAKLAVDEEYERLANDDPAAFSQRYLTVKAQEKIAEQQAKEAARIQEEYTKAISEGLQTEMQDLTPEEFAQLQAAVVNKQGKEVLGAFTRASARIIADRQIKASMSTFKAKELDQEREALRTEEAAKLLKKSERPDLRNGAQSPGKFDPTKLDDKKFDEWYRTEILART